MTAAAKKLKLASPAPLAPKLTARDIMMRDPFTVEAESLVVEAAATMIARGVSNAPVVRTDFQRKLLAGFISEKDVIQCYASGRLYSQPDLQVGEIMRTHPIGVRPEADLFTLAAIFMQLGYRHLPVVVANLLQGVVSRRDVLKGLLDHYESWRRQDPATRKAPDIAGIFTPRYLLG